MISGKALLVAALLAVACAGAFPQAAWAARDPLAVIRSYIDRAARQIQPPAEVRPKKKKAKAAAPKVARIDPAIVPIPRTRPVLAASALAVATWAPPEVSAGAEWRVEIAAAASVPVALPRMAMAITMPRLRPAKPRVTPASLPPTEDAIRLPSVALAALGISSVPLPPIADGDCGMPDPVAVASLAGGDVKLTAKTILNQKMTEKVALWIRDQVAPTARAIFKDDLTGIRVAASYDCRTRSHVAGAELSEHAFGNAIDISAFRIAKRWVEVGAFEAPAEDQYFLATIRESACGPFTTVLGPGVAAHDTHFHLDLAKRGRSGRSLYCR